MDARYTVLRRPYGDATCYDVQDAWSYVPSQTWIVGIHGTAAECAAEAHLEARQLNAER